MRKLNTQKYIHSINDNVGQGRLSENLFNAKNYCTEYFRYEIFAIYGMFKDSYAWYMYDVQYGIASFNNCRVFPMI